MSVRQLLPLLRHGVFVNTPEESGHSEVFDYIVFILNHVEFARLACPQARRPYKVSVATILYLLLQG